MKISPVNIQNTYFKSKHRDTRKADDLMRKTNLAFPMFNPSYAYYFYDSIDINKPQNYPQREKFELGICRNFIKNVRKPSDFMEDFQTPFDIPHSYLLGLLKDKKMGNCKEAAITVLCALYANGYHNSQKISLGYDYKIVDKKTKEVLLKGEVDIDHSAVLTDLNIPERSSNLNKTIIIDPWLEYTGTVSEANGKYKMQFGKFIDIKMKEIMMLNNINSEDCIIETSIFYSFGKKHSKEEAKRIGNFVKTKYPELVYEII